MTARWTMSATPSSLPGCSTRPLPASRPALAELLAPHIAVEEQALFPALVDEFPEHVRVLLADHDVIEHVVEEISRARRPELGWDRRLLEAMDLLRGHLSGSKTGCSRRPWRA